MFQTSLIASGSKGNCLLIRTRDHAVILDAGISVSRVMASLERLQVPPEIVRGVLVTHEHSDHSGSAGALCRKLRVPLYISPDTYMNAKHKLGKMIDLLQWIKTDTPFPVGDIICEPFSSSHDADDSCNFRFFQEGNPSAQLGVATDLGYPTLLTVNKLTGSTTLVLESNHDEVMLITGPYPWHLKQRVKSKKGHLSNLQAVELMGQLHHPGLRTLVLAHLSENNNHPDLAYKEMKQFLDSIQSDAELIIAGPDRETRLIDI